MADKYDLIVIGSGLGGLVSALIFAKEGKKVAVLEKNNQFGGNLQTFSRDKAIFDTGVHYVGGLDSGQNLNKLFTYLEILDDLKFTKLNRDKFDAITFDDDAIEYPFAQGYANFVNQLSIYFPEERNNIANYCSSIQEFCNSFPWYNIVKGVPYKEELLAINAKTHIESFTKNKKLQAILAGNNFLYVGLPEHTPFYIHALILNSYILSSYRFIHGGSQITKALIKQIKKFNGEVYKHTEVEGFEFNDAKIKSVVTKNGVEFSGDLFISNIDPKTTMNWIGKERVRNVYFNRIQAQKPLPSVFSLHIVFKKEAFPYINYNYYHFKDENAVWDSVNYTQENWPASYMISMNVEEENQQWAKSLTAMTYMNFDEVVQWEATQNTKSNPISRGDLYEKFKEEKAELFLNELEKKFPTIKSALATVYTSSPLSYRDYIGGDKGNLYGYVKDCKNPLFSKISPKTKIENLYLTGQSVSLHGVLGVTIGAFITCSEHFGHEYLLNKVIAKNEQN